MGPTASGKTGLAIELAQQLPCEIVSVDSALVYRHMDIGTAKPDAATLAAAPHALIDIIEPTQSYSAAQFREDALRLMAEITARGRIPLLAGGTMLYFKALAQGLSDLPQADPALRAELDEKAQRLGWPALHAELARLDPVTAARLKPTDAQRIQRALEVCRLAGRPMSELVGREDAVRLPYDVAAVALVPGDRAELHRRIAQRFDAMLRQGLIEEVRGLKARYPLSPDMPSMRCVGYRQVWQYLDGEYDFDTLRDKGIAATRQLAKRQLTWLRSMPNVTAFDCLEEGLNRRVLAYLREKVTG
ncbi:MAG: tRNA (adenosine(37)-N6)-dimethylallyltransferase MiaA [Pseudomonadota bacterium]|jgi:tRNA dimethylallyltransferase